MASKSDNQAPRATADDKGSGTRKRRSPLTDFHDAAETLERGDGGFAEAPQKDMSGAPLSGSVSDWAREMERAAEADARAALQQLDPLWDELFPAEQARIAALLVERVDIGTDGLNVRLRMDGLTGLAREMMADLGTAA
jgi:hypothetical protein